MLLRSLIDLATLSWVYASPATCEAIGFDFETDNRSQLLELDFFVPKIYALEVELASGASQFDVIVVGSGCGGGVVAHKLVDAGYSVLVLEKGKYINPKDMPTNPFEVDKLTFEQQARLVSDDGSTNVLAGATVGGGGAVNWSCSLRTTQGVREEWSEAGVPWYTSTVYDDALDYVMDKMGCTTDIGRDHSFTNKLLLDTAALLEYPAKACPQNTGKHPYNNRFHGSGLRSGEKGGIGVWLEGAMAKGAQLADDATCLRIVRSNKKAIGVEALIGGQRNLIRSKRVVSSAGSLHTPTLLLRSGFTNKHIGRGLKLHPVTLLLGDHDEVVNKSDDPIMTAVSTIADNLDNQYHGPKIESMHHLPQLISKFAPWHDGFDYARRCLRYKHTSGLLIITRDKGEGRVWLDKSDPLVPKVDYTPSKYDLWALSRGCLYGANMQYLGGAREIIYPSPDAPSFYSSKPKEQRRINDPDYQAWHKLVSKAVLHTYSTSIGSAHQMSSCRMSNKGPKHAPVDEKGRLHECQNVHIIDTSVFPTASGVNPMVSVLATSVVLANFLVDDLRKSEKPRL